jgi:hypothetical protein
MVLESVTWIGTRRPSFGVRVPCRDLCGPCSQSGPDRERREEEEASKKNSRESHFEERCAEAAFLRREVPWPAVSEPEGLRLCLFHLILLEFAVKRGFSDAEHAGSGELVTSGFA